MSARRQPATPGEPPWRSGKSGDGRLSDEELLERSGEDESAFLALLKRYRRSIKGFLARFGGTDEGDAEFVIVAGIRGAQRKPPGQLEFRRYVFRVARNFGLRTQKGHDRRSEILLGELDDPLHYIASQQHCSGEPDTDYLALSLAVATALDGLAERERTVFLLRHYHNLPISEIASRLDASNAAVKSALTRARRKLSQHPALTPWAPRRREPSAASHTHLEPDNA
jgi:RNA polymerase sigma factor (sigma-70 family)